MTPVVASWLQDYLFDVNPIVSALVQPYSFAGQTPGNASFVEYVNKTFYKVSGWRYYNSFDIVPMAYNKLLDTIDIYQSAGIDCPKPLADLIKIFNDKVDADNYLQPDGEGYKLDGSIEPNIDYIKEVAHQHSHTTYLKLIGVNNSLTQS